MSFLAQFFIIFYIETKWWDYESNNMRRKYY